MEHVAQWKKSIPLFCDECRHIGDISLETIRKDYLIIKI